MSATSRPRRALALAATLVGAAGAPALLAPRAVSAQAQATTGVVRGTVADSTGRPLEGVTVTLRHLETNATRTVVTNDRGAFVAQLLRVGTYDVAARRIGFAEAQRRGIALRLGETREIGFTLRTQATQLSAVRVTGGAVATVETERSVQATRLDTAALAGIPNNGRNVLSLTTLAPNVAVTQGPDGDVISVAGQKGIQNNISVDGADFNNPFFGEQRGGQRPAFVFNLDAVEDFVVVSQGANAEFGRSSGGFVNIITKSGTNTFKGTAHYFGQGSGTSANLADGTNPRYLQNQFGFTLGGPIRRDRAFFFVAYDQQLFDQTKQTLGNRFASAPLRAWLDSANGGALRGDYRDIARTNDAQVALAKLDVRLSDNHQASLKYNFTNASQRNGTFDVDVWGRSANGLERSYSHAVNGALNSTFRRGFTNEFRFQVAREDRPRPYEGPVNPATGRRFPDTGVSFDGYRFGQPFFLPVEAYDTRLQLLDNVSVVRGNHLLKVGGEWNRTLVNQTFQGFANGRFIFSSVDGFLNYNRFGPGYVECSNGSTSTSGACAGGASITGPVLLYLQQVGLDGRTPAEAGTQTLVQHDLALFAQDSWKPNTRLTVNYGLRWEAQVQPDPITDPSRVFFQPLVGRTVTNATGAYPFPSDGTIPSDWRMFQPRLGLAYDVNGDGKQVLRGNAGVYYARVPGLVFAGTRTTNGSIGQTLFRNSELTPILGAPPAYGQLLATPAGGPFRPDITVTDRNFRNPRTLSATAAYERELFAGVAGSVTYTYAATDFLTRFVNRNDAVFGSPWQTGIGTAGNGIGQLTVVESSARSRYHGVTVELRRSTNPNLQWQVNYTLSYDRSDDDNERDPFTFRYARADRLDREWGYSDRDQRHRFNAWLLARLPYRFNLNNRITALSAQPMSASCGRPGTPAAGQRAVNFSDRICADGSILRRNTLRRDNAFFTWDVRLSRVVRVRNAQAVELIAEAFNVTNTNNFRDPASASLLFNFDGTLRSGLGDPRRIQLGARYVF